MKTHLKNFWQFIRQLSGDADYENYLSALPAHQTPLTRKYFYRQKECHKWQGYKRCC